MKELVISFAALALTGGGWGAIYYNEIVLPREQAYELSRLWEEGMQSIGVSDKIALMKDGADAVEKAVRDEREKLSMVRIKVNDLLVREEFGVLQQEFLAFLDGEIFLREKNEQEVGLLARIELFLSEFERVFLVLEQPSFPPYKEKDPSLPVIRTIGDLERFWSVQIPKAQEAGSSLVAAQGASLFSVENKAKLAREWTSAMLHLKNILSFVKKSASNPSLTPEIAISRMPPAEYARIQKSFESLEISRKFFQGILAPIIESRANFPINERSIEMSERAFRMYKGMRDMKDRFGIR